MPTCLLFFFSNYNVNIFFVIADILVYTIYLYLSVYYLFHGENNVLAVIIVVWTTDNSFNKKRTIGERKNTKKTQSSHSKP